MKRLLTATIMFGLALLGGCGSAMELPASFVELGSQDDGSYGRNYVVRGVSPEGVIIALRKIDNPKNGTLEFWAKAIENELSQEGHSLVENSPVRSDAGTGGRLMTFSSVHQGEEFTYMLAIFVEGERILVAEAGGKAVDVKKHAEDINKSLLTAK